jgi:hypothetical protein
MKSIKISAVYAALMLVILAGGCAKPPAEEMNRAIEAVTRAENDADASMYAENTLGRARDALNRMRSEADSKRYDAAKTYAAEAISLADKAIADGRAGAARIRDEAAALIAELKPAIAETAQGINAAQSAGLALDFDAIDREFEAARADASQAEIAFSGNRYRDAVDRGRTARADLSDINQKLSNAALASSRKK